MLIRVTLDFVSTQVCTCPGIYSRLLILTSQPPLGTASTVSTTALKRPGERCIIRPASNKPPLHF